MHFILTRLKPLLLLPAVLCCPAESGVLGSERPAAPAQARQQQAQALTRQMLSGVLDRQLAQLEQNGLADLPLHGEIARMRGNLDRMVAEEMQHVVEMLVEWRQAPADQRTALEQRVRGEIREIVARLAEERRQVQQRLRAHRVAADLGRLLERQQQVREATERLPTLSAAERDEQLLRLTEDQKDIRAFFGDLQQTLEAASQTDDPGGEVESSLRALESAGVGRELDAAVAALEQGRHPQAERHQRQIVRGLEAALDETRTSPAVPHGEEEPARRVREAAEAQAELFDRTRRGFDDLEQADDAVSRQGALARELAEVRRLVHDDPPAGRLADAAREEAEAAAAALFQRDPHAASQHQRAALEALEALAAQLPPAEGHPPAAGDEQAAEAGETEPPSPVPPRGSGELAARAEDLDKLAGFLDQLADQQRGVAEQAGDAPQAAAELERRIAEALERIAEARPWDRPVAEPLAEARREAQAAAEALADLRPEAQELAAQAGERIEAARQAAAEAQHRTERQAAAAEFGELSRAAEALDRAAAVEQRLADTPADEPWDASQLAESHRRQQAVEQVARHVAESIEEKTPQDAEQLRAAAEQVRQLETELQAAVEAARQGGDIDAPQKQEIARRAADVADALNQVADQLRQQMAQAANEQALGEQQAQAMQQAAEQQQQARDALAEAARQMQAAQAEADAGGDAADQAAGEAAGQQAEQALQQAMEQYAAAQQAAGQQAAEMAGQNEVGEPNLRQALQAARELANGESGASADDAGFVPSDPMQTARMIAGQDGKQPGEQAGTEQPGPPGEEQANGQATPNGGESQSGEGESGEGESGEGESGEGESGEGESGEGESGEGESGEGEGGEGEGEGGEGGESSGRANGADGGSGSGSEENGPTGQSDPAARQPAHLKPHSPWLLDLPPEARAAIQAAGRRPAPPGYENRLRRYFESLE